MYLDAVLGHAQALVAKVHRSVASSTPGDEATKAAPPSPTKAAACAPPASDDWLDIEDPPSRAGAMEGMWAPSGVSPPSPLFDSGSPPLEWGRRGGVKTVEPATLLITLHVLFKPTCV